MTNNLRELQKYMSDFAQLLVELDNIKKRIEYVESILPRVNTIYLQLVNKSSNTINIINNEQCKHDWHLFTIISSNAHYDMRCKICGAEGTQGKDDTKD